MVVLNGITEFLMHSGKSMPDKHSYLFFYMHDLNEQNQITEAYSLYT